MIASRYAVAVSLLVAVALVPTIIIIPISTPRIEETSSGPGVGGTKVCVIAPPVAIAIRYLR